MKQDAAYLEKSTRRWLDATILDQEPKPLGGAVESRKSNPHIGCPDERMHLHILARLCLMAQKTEVLAELRQASTSDVMYEVMINSELAILETLPGLDHASLPRH